MTTEVATNWILYTKPPSEGRDRLVARPSALSNDALTLRLGSQLFRKDKDEKYREIPICDSPVYYEEVSGRGSLVVIGSRSHALAAQLKEPYRLFENLGRDLTYIERLEHPSDDNKPCAIHNESDDEWLFEASPDSSGSESDMEMEAYESWSEGSTDDDGYVSTSSSSESDASESQTADSGSEAESEDDSHSTSSGKSDDDAESASGKDTPSVLARSAFPSLDGSQDNVSEEDLWGMEVDARLGVQPFNNIHEPTVLLTVLHYNDDSIPTKLFEYSCPLRFMLYDSPSAIHPHESLVVWPLGGGDLLFADVAAKTYFTRQLRPSAPHSES